MADKIANIYEKLSMIQCELKAPKNQYSDYGGYFYRNCEDILEAVKPLCNKHRMTLTLCDGVVLIGERYYIKAVATLTDWDSDANISNIAYARETEKKLKMDDSQITGATSSYARKYALNGLFNIDDTKDADDPSYHKSKDEQLDENKKREKAIADVTKHLKTLDKEFDIKATDVSMNNYIMDTKKVPTTVVDKLTTDQIWELANIYQGIIINKRKKAGEKHA